MICIKIFKKNKFIGYFSFEAFDYKLPNNYNKKIPNYLEKDFKIKNFRPLKYNVHFFENEDLYNGVILSHLNELKYLFKNNDWYKDYTYNLYYISFSKIENNKYE